MSTTPENLDETRTQRGRRHLRQFIKFGVVGGSGVVVNMIVTFIMTRMHGGTIHDNDILFRLFGDYAFRWTILVWILAFIVANFWNFQLNRSWTFKRDVQRSYWKEFWPFFAVGAVAAAVGIFIKMGLTNPTSAIYLPSPMFNDHQGLRARAYWSQLITIVVTLPINFVVNKLWTFRAVKHDPADVPMVASVVAPEALDELT